MSFIKYLSWNLEKVDQSDLNPVKLLQFSVLSLSDKIRQQNIFLPLKYLRVK